VGNATGLRRNNRQGRLVESSECGKVPAADTGDDDVTESNLTAKLNKLQDDYGYRVNLLLDQGREDLAREIADEHLVKATELVRDHAA